MVAYFKRGHQEDLSIRHKIEDLFEEKRLKEELSELGWAWIDRDLTYNHAT